VVSWLAKKVGPTGKVVATDIDTSWATSAFRPPVELRVHDVGVDEPPGEGFDLVHARLVLVHVPDRERALRSMIKSLRPGGRLLVEDADPALQPLACPDERGPEQQLANRLRHGFRKLLTEHGADLAYGRRLPRPAPRGRAATGRGRRVLPDHLTGLRRAGVRDDPSDPRPARRRGPRHGRGHRPPPRERGRGRDGPGHGTPDLGVGAQGVAPGGVEGAPARRASPPRASSLRRLDVGARLGLLKPPPMAWVGPGWVGL
jgi:SAM-dependent methyltransferase